MSDRLVTGKVLDKIRDHAQRDYPREACGLILNRGGKPLVWPCANLSQHPEVNFLLSPHDYANAEQLGDVIAVYHSHPNAMPVASMADRSACEVSGVPWYVVAWPQFGVDRIEPCGYKAPLRGRPFVHGVHDCYSIIRDWYLSERAIALPDFPREWEWWLKGGNLYLENFGKAGFGQIDPAIGVQAGDVFLMQLRAAVPEHAALYEGNGHIVQHVAGRLSTRDVYGGYWLEKTTHVLRFVGNDGSR